MHSGAPPMPADEAARAAALRSLSVLDTPAEEEFDAIVKLAAEICDVPIALVSLVDESRQWFKAKVGLDAAQTPRDVSYCGHAILGDQTMVVPDASVDPRFVDNPLRTGVPRAEFYAGVPLRLSSGHNVGTLCVIDHTPRSLTPAQLTSLEALAAQVVRLLEMRRTTLLSREAVAALRADEDELRAVDSIHPPSVSRPFSWLALMFAVVLGGASVFASLRVRAMIEGAGDERLQRAGERAASFLHERVEAYAQILRGTGALLEASEHVSENEFRTYTQALSLRRNYPGLLGLGYAERVPRAELTRWLDEVQRTSPGFRVVTTGDASVLAINRFVEPRERNAAAIGFDAYTNPVRRAAMEASLARHDVSLTGRVVLRQDERHPGFLMYLPVPSRAPVGENRGWVIAAVRTRDLVRGLRDAVLSDVGVRVIDRDQEVMLVDEDGASRALTSSLPVRIADHDIRVEVSPGKTFYSWSERTEPWAILLLGLAATLLTVALTVSVRRTEARSQKLALRMTRALRRGERELRAVIDGTTDLVVSFGETGRVHLTNRAFRHALGYDKNDLTSMFIEDVVLPAERDTFRRAIERAARDGHGEHVETTFLARSGSTIEVEGALHFVEESEERITRAIFRDVSARKQTERALRTTNIALERLATTDALTGMANRRLFDARLAEEVARATRHGGALTLAMIDVDYFKRYNDSDGHQAGDACLQRVASCLKQSVRRAGEVAARYGGEEFALILPGTNLEAAHKLAESVRRNVFALGLPHRDHPLGVVTVSIGVASLDVEGMKHAEDLLVAADQALYRAKAGGRNRVEVARTNGASATPATV